MNAAWKENVPIKPFSFILGGGKGKKDKPTTYGTLLTSKLLPVCFLTTVKNLHATVHASLGAILYPPATETALSTCRVLGSAASFGHSSRSHVLSRSHSGSQARFFVTICCLNYFAHSYRTRALVLPYPTHGCDHSTSPGRKSILVYFRENKCITVIPSSYVSHTSAWSPLHDWIFFFFWNIEDGVKN